MTYDPFSFGQVDLKPEQRSGGASPDDLLFADGPGPSRAAPPADSSWGLLDADVDSLLPGAKSAPTNFDFGSDVLGEAPPPAAAPAAPAPAPTRAKPSATPRPAAEPAIPGARGPSALEAPRREVTGRPIVAPQPAASPSSSSSPAAAEATPTYVARKPSSVGRIGRPSLASTIVPATLFSTGGAVAAWLYWMDHNPMMAGIVGALTIVASIFARLFLRH